MFNKSILAAALLTVGAIAGGSAVSAAEIGVRSSYGTSWSNVYGGQRVFESDTQSSTASDFRGGSLTVSATSSAAAQAATEFIPQLGTAVLGLDVLQLDESDLAGVGPLTRQGDADGPKTGTNIGGGSNNDTGSGGGGKGARPRVSATITAAVSREASFSQSRSMLNESARFSGGSSNTFSEVSTFTR